MAHTTPQAPAFLRRAPLSIASSPPENVQPPLHQPRDLDEDRQRLETAGAQLEDELERMRQPTPLPPAPKLPGYVEHAPDIDEVGKLSSQALVISYEESAKKFDAVAERLKEEMRACREQTVAMVKFLETTEKDMEDAINSCYDAAEAYRKEAKATFERIQDRAILAAKARQTCSSLIDEISGT